MADEFDLHEANLPNILGGFYPWGQMLLYSCTAQQLPQVQSWVIQSGELVGQEFSIQ